MLNIAGLGVSICSLISVILALALQYWVYGSASLGGAKVEVYSGLFKQCHYNVGFKTCYTLPGSIETGKDDFKAVTAMVFLALFAIVGAIVCQVLKLFPMKDQTRLPYLAAGLMVVAGVFLLIGFAVYVARIYNPIFKEYVNLHAGFAFCVIAWITSWVSAGLIVMSAMRDK